MMDGRTIMQLAKQTGRPLTYEEALRCAEVLRPLLDGIAQLPMTQQTPPAFLFRPAATPRIEGNTR